jgi:hypothetical protein
MEINHILVKRPVITPEKPEQKPAQQGDFSQYLRQAMDPPVSLPAQSLPPASLVLPPVSLSGPIAPGSPEALSLGQAETLLNHLEEYQARLADPNTTLKQAFLDMEKMEASLHTLSSTMEQLPAGSQSRGLLEEIAALALTQSVKFRRGDYLE